MKSPVSAVIFAALLFCAALPAYSLDGGPPDPPPIDSGIHGRLETARFAMGCFWAPEVLAGLPESLK